MKKLDRRVRRTRRLLRDACIALILEKGYESITVEEIAERADVGRTTFYMHYRDKGDLFASSIGRISEELHERIAPLLFSEQGIIADKPAQMIFEHAQENADLYRVVLSGAGNGQVLRQLRRELARYARYAYEAEVTQLELMPSVPVEVTAQYVAAATLGLVEWWLEEGMPHPAEDMTRMFRRLLLLGRAQVMGIDASLIEI